MQIAQQEFLAALGHGEIHRIRELVLAGADVNCPIGNPGGETPLIRAITTAQLDLVKALLENGADASLAWKGPTRWTPLMFAHDNPEMVAELIAAGADVNAHSAAHPSAPGAGAAHLRSGGETALHLAAAANNAESVRLLAQAGADVEARTDNGSGPLDYALARGVASAAAVALVEAGAQLTPERSEKMHSTAHAPDSDLLQFPSYGENAPAQSQGTLVQTRQPDEPKPELRCPHCQALLYSSVPKLCGSCGKLLPPEMLAAAHEARAAQNGRKWAWELANKFDTRGSTRRYEPNAPTNPSPTPEQLLRQVSCTDEFKNRKRPLFMFYVLGYNLVFLLPVIIVASLKIVDPLPLLGVAMGFIALLSYRAWLLASPICPNCKQNITRCAANYCHLCGEPLQDRRCATCYVHASRFRFGFGGNYGNFRRVIYCPGCHVLLDSRVPRFRRKGW